MGELKTCPFCGGKAKAYVKDYGDTHYWRVSCSSDRCGVNPVTNVYHTEANAIAAWNTRAKRTCCNVDKDGDFECSLCGFYWALHPHYCPNCGAKVMDE